MVAEQAGAISQRVSSVRSRGSSGPATKTIW